MAEEPELREDDRNNWVRYLQGLLKDFGMYDGETDEWFGPLTKTAVDRLQAHYQINEGGVVGPETWKLLELSKQENTEMSMEIVAENVGTVDVRDEEGSA